MIALNITYQNTRLVSGHILDGGTASLLETFHCDSSVIMNYNYDRFIDNHKLIIKYIMMR